MPSTRLTGSSSLGSAWSPRASRLRKQPSQAQVDLERSSPCGNTTDIKEKKPYSRVCLVLWLWLVRCWTLTGYSGLLYYSGWLSNRSIPKLLVFDFTFFLLLYYLVFSISIFYLSYIRFYVTPYLLYIDQCTILITLSRSYHARLRVSHTHTFTLLRLLISFTIVVLTYLR